MNEKIITLMVLQNTVQGKTIYTIRDGVTGVQRNWIPDIRLQGFPLDCALAQQIHEVKREIRAILKAKDLCDDPRNIGKMCLYTYVTQKYWPRKEQKLAHTTRDSWQRIIYHRILPRFGDVALEDITAADITDWLYALQNAENLSDATLRKYATVLQNIISMARRTDKLATNPMDGVDIPSHNADALPTAPVAYTAEQIAEIDRIMADQPLHWRAMYYLLEDTGIRRGEALGLTWDNVDWNASQIHITYSLGYTPERGIYLGPTKGRRTRTVPISAHVVALLRELDKRNRKQYLRSDFVFCRSTAGKTHLPMHPSTVSAYFRQIGKRNAIIGLHPHILRHSYASVAITHGADIASVSELLGHSNKSITMDFYTSSNHAAHIAAATVHRNVVATARQQLHR